MKILLFFCLITFLTARPPRPRQLEGEVRNYKNQKHFTFDNTHLKRSSRNSADYKYDIELVDNYHSLDEEEYIEDVKCTEKTLTLYSKQELTEWKENDVISGSDMWKCKYPMARKIKGIKYERKENELYVYSLETENAQIQDFFKHAEISYKAPEEIEIESVEKEEHLKAASYGAIFITPEDETVVDTVNGVDVEYIIKGCSQDICGDVQITAAVYKSVTLWIDELKDAVLTTCTASTNYNCKVHIPMIGDYDNYEKNYVRLTYSILGKEYEEESEIFETNTYRILFHEPKKGTIVKQGDILTVTWEPSQTLLNQFSSVIISTYQYKPIWFDDDIETITIDPSKREFNFTISADKYEKGKTYYFTYECDDETIESEKFVVATDEMLDSVELTYPDPVTVVQAGSQLTVKWDYDDLPSFSTMTIRIMKSIIFWFDSELIEITDVPVADKYYTITIPEDAEESSRYYIEFEYTRAGCDDKSHVFGELFSISKEPKFSMISSSLNEETQQMTIRWKLLEYVGSYHVSLHQKFPLFSPLDKQITGTESYLHYHTDITQTYTDTFTYTEGTPFTVYVQFSYKCLFGKYFCEEEKYYVDDIPYEVALNWNYDEQTKSPIESNAELFNLNCNSGQADGIAGEAFQAMCSRFPNTYFELSSTCKDCYIRTPTKIHGFEISMNAGKVYKAAVEVTTDLHLNIDLLTVIKGGYHLNYQIPIGIPLKNIFTIPIGPILITLQTGADVSASIQFDIDAMFSVEAMMYKHYQIVFSFDSTKEDSFNFIHSDLTPKSQIKTAVNGAVDIYFEPNFYAKLNLGFGLYYTNFIEGSIDFDLGLGLALGYQYPAYPPDETYNELPHFVRIDFGPFLYMNYLVTIFDEVLTSDNLELFNNKLDYHVGLFTTTEDHTFKLKLDINNKLEKLVLAVLSTEIGQLSHELNSLKSKKYNPSNVDMNLDISTTLELKRSDSYMNYMVNLYDDNADYDLTTEVKNCLESTSCPITISEENYPRLKELMKYIVVDGKVDPDVDPIEPDTNGDDDQENDENDADDLNGGSISTFILSVFFFIVLIL